MGDKTLKLKFRPEYIPIILFVLATLFYLNIDKVPLTHPGNLKAADAFYHSMMVEGILDTKQWNYFDSFVSLGQEKAVNVQPPLYYINSAILTLFSNIPSWVMIYILFCITQALFSLVTYLIAKEVFEEDNIGIIAASLAVLPLSLKAWLYSLYIGIWLQIASFLFLFTFLWLFIRYLKKKEDWTLVFMGICISSVLLTHPMDLFFMFLPSVIVGLDLLNKNKKNIVVFVKKGFMFALIPLISIISMLPRILFQWSHQGSGQFKFGFYTPNEVYITRNYLEGLPFPDIFYVHWIILIIFTFGLIQLMLNWKKYKTWLISTFYYFGIIYLSVFLVQESHYFGRARYITPYIIYPTVAYIIYFLVNQFLKSLKSKKLKEIYLVCFISIIIVAASIPSYNLLKNSMQGEHITLNEWPAYLWIQKNTPKDSKLLFFGTATQAEYMYSKRISGVFGFEEFNRIISLASQNNITSTEFNGAWGGNTLRATRRYEISLTNYAEYPEPSNILKLEEFDYVVFNNLNEQIMNINYYFANQYITKYGFVPVYDQNGVFILKNERS